MIDKADTLWVLLSTILVLLMILPGLVMFYGGMVRNKNVLSVMNQVLATVAVVFVLWFAFGYSFAFTEGNKIWGSMSRLFFNGMFDIKTEKFELNGAIPEVVYASFQMIFAAIACCLIVGGFAERMKFSAVLVFMVIWFTLSYIPVCHMIWASGGLLLGDALDFAGGTVIHINAGIAALLAAYVVGPRIGFGKEALQPHNLTMTMVGASLLWIGWFGFNAGSALGINFQAALALLNTALATAGGIMGWMAIEWWRKSKPSLLGGSSGAVAGLVGITPGAAYVGPEGAILIGLICGVVCEWAVTFIKIKLKIDDTLDVFGVHGVGGIVGGILTGVFNAQALGGPGYESLSQMPLQVWHQTEGILIVLVWSSIVTFGALWVAKKLFKGLRVDRDSEREGLDIASHGERAYKL